MKKDIKILHAKFNSNLVYIYDRTGIDIEKLKKDLEANIDQYNTMQPQEYFKHAVNLTNKIIKKMDKFLVQSLAEQQLEDLKNFS